VTTDMTLDVDLFWSFRSPYSYLALTKTKQLLADYDVRVHARPVYPLAVRDPTFFARTNPKFPRYVVLDSTRVAQSEGIPFRFPRPDPIVQNMETLVIAKDQPRIRPLMRLAAAAQLEGKSFAFVDEIARMLWGGQVDGWDQGDHVARATARAGLDFAKLDAAVAADPARFDAVITDNEAAQEQSGHWGVPLFVFNGEAFFGQDRIDLLVWRMKQHGLARRK
jgi:2-hydroxychromene-2-carboxylate isomerase